MSGLLGGLLLRDMAQIVSVVSLKKTLELRVARFYAEEAGIFLVLNSSQLAKSLLSGADDGNAARFRNVDEAVRVFIIINFQAVTLRSGAEIGFLFVAHLED